jgi:hypothetical protein
MRIKKILTFLILILKTLLSFAQIDDLLKNKDITWVAEISTDLVLDNPDSAVAKRLNWIRTLKLLPNQKVSGSDDRLEFSYIIHDAIKSDKIPFYSDSTCQKRIFAKTLTHIDTVIKCFEPMPDGKFYFLLYNFPKPTDFKVFRAHQIVFYNSKKAQFGLRTLAFAPLEEIRNEAGDFIDIKPLCWIKADDISKRPKLSSDDIIWARKLSTYKGFDLTKAMVLKQTSSESPMIHLLNIAEKDTKKTFFSSESSTDMRKLPFNELGRVFFWRDTIYEIDGISSKVIENHVEKSEIKNLRLIQEWFWDERKQKLRIHFVAAAPMKEITDEAGQFLYWKPLFYRRVDTD